MAEPAVYARFDTSAVPPGDRFDYWRARVAPLRLESAGTSVCGFGVSAQTLHAGGAGVIEMYRGPAMASWGREAGQAQGRLRLVVFGRAAGAVAHWYGSDVPLAGGGAALLGPTDGWWRAPAGLRGIEVDVPRAAVAVTDAELARINAGRRLAADPVFASLARPALTEMAGRLEEFAGAGGGLGTVWTALITMLVRSVTGQHLDGADVAAARRLQAERFIRARLSDPRLSPGDVAAALHISRRSLYASAFPGDGGVAAYIRQQRLQRARRLLTDPARALPVSQVAVLVGLPDPAHFSRLFRAEYGRSPRDLRARPG